MSPNQRALGRIDPTCIGINSVVGSSIFLFPGTLAASLGPEEGAIDLERAVRCCAICYPKTGFFSPIHRQASGLMRPAKPGGIMLAMRWSMHRIERAVSVVVLTVVALQGSLAPVNAEEEGDALNASVAILSGVQNAGSEDASARGFDAQQRLQGGVAGLFDGFRDRAAKSDSRPVTNADPELVAKVKAQVGAMTPQQRAGLHRAAIKKIETLPKQERQEVLQQLDVANARHYDDSGFWLFVVIVSLIGGILDVFFSPHRHGHY